MEEGNFTWAWVGAVGGRMEGFKAGAIESSGRGVIYDMES